MDPETIVRDFCNAFARQDLAELLGYFAEGAVYHNIPLPPNEGLAAIEATLKGFLDPTGEAEFRLLNFAVSGRSVLTERLDILTIGGKRIEIPEIGTFEIDADGKIAAWRDYFDMGMLQSQLS